MYPYDQAGSSTRPTFHKDPQRRQKPIAPVGTGKSQWKPPELLQLSGQLALCLDIPLPLIRKTVFREIQRKPYAYLEHFNVETK